MSKAETSNQGRRARYKRITLWFIAIIVLGAMVLPLGSYVYVGIQQAQAQAVKDTNPRANYWRAVRDGQSGYSAVTGTSMDGQVINTETNMLINNGGQNWRQIRDGLVANYGGWFLFVVLIAIMLFFAKVGRVPVASGMSGQKVQRWNALDRLVHWVTAISFIVLAISGLSLLFGRAVLIPLMGYPGFAAYAGLAKGLHNFVGPWLFTPGVALMIILWIRHNIPNAEDLQWFAQGGGFGKSHPHAGFANAGEKVWFWFICTVGVAAIVTGFFMDFPNWWSASREGMQLANVVHAVTGVLWIALWFGHAYMGTVGTEGALEGMTSGYVDVNWAKQHHDRWYEQAQAASREQGREATTEVKGQPA